MATPVFKLYRSSSASYFDFTSAVNWQNYSVNAEEIVKNWTDANGKIHKNVVRLRITGTVEVGFETAKSSNLWLFLDTLAGYRNNDGTYTVQLYVANKDEVTSLRAFIDVDGGASRYDFRNDRYFKVDTLTIEEP